MPQVSLEHVQKTFRDRKAGEVVAVRDLTLSVAAGEVLVLLGPSGSGKTTVLRILAGLEAPSAGRVLFEGRDVARVPPQGRDVGMVFQSGALFPHLTVAENMALGLRLRRVSREEIGQRVGEAAAGLGILPLLHRRPGELSGGERQRVALGRALVSRPSLLLLDEPLAGLDAPRRVELRRALERIPRRPGTTILHVTHDQTEAFRLGQRIAVLRGGELQQVAEPRELYERPANSFVAGFIGSPPMNLIPGQWRAEGGATVFAVGEAAEGGATLKVPSDVASRLRSLKRSAVTLGIRAEDLEICRSGAGQDVGVVRAEVELREAVGAEAWLHLRLGNASVVARGPRGEEWQPGDRISVAVPWRRAHWFDTESGMALLR